MNDVEKFLAILRDAVPDAEHVFMHGRCWELYRLLRDRWPEAELWSEDDGSHVLTKIGNAWYDIRGKHVRRQANWTRPCAHDVRRWKTHRWAPQHPLQGLIDKRARDEEANIAAHCEAEEFLWD